MTIDANNYRTTELFDAAGNTTPLTDASNNVSTFAYRSSAATKEEMADGVFLTTSGASISGVALRKANGRTGLPSLTNC